MNPVNKAHMNRDANKTLDQIRFEISHNGRLQIGIEAHEYVWTVIADPIWNILTEQVLHRVRGDLEQ